MVFSPIMFKGFLFVFAAKTRVCFTIPFVTHFMSSGNDAVRYNVNADGCLESKATVKKVASCPQSIEKWREAAERKQCESVKNVCSSFTYHCVSNTWRNETIEVCAPRLNIVGKNCAEYNYGGSRIQRNRKVHCEECPTTYDSTQSFKYKECFQLILHATSPSTNLVNVECCTQERVSNEVYRSFETSYGSKDTSYSTQIGRHIQEPIGDDVMHVTSSGSNQRPTILIQMFFFIHFIF